LRIPVFIDVSDSDDLIPGSFIFKLLSLSFVGMAELIYRILLETWLITLLKSKPVVMPAEFDSPLLSKKIIWHYSGGFGSHLHYQSIETALQYAC